MRRCVHAVGLLLMVGVLLTGTLTAAAQSGNLIRNPGFELDANGDGRPDDWLPAASDFTRSQTLSHAGSYSGKYLLTSVTHSAKSQRVVGITAGSSYVFTGWLNIDATPGTRFAFDIEFQWRNSAGAVIGRTLVRGGGETKAWLQKRAAVRAPRGAADLQIVMHLEQKSRGSIIVFVDDFKLVRV